LVYLDIIAPGFQISQKMSSRSSDGDDTATTTSRKTTLKSQKKLTDEPVSEEEQMLHRGQREMNSLTIETIGQGDQLFYPLAVILFNEKQVCNQEGRKGCIRK